MHALLSSDNSCLDLFYLQMWYNKRYARKEAAMNRKKSNISLGSLLRITRCQTVTLRTDSLSSSHSRKRKLKQLQLYVNKCLLFQRHKEVITK